MLAKLGQISARGIGGCPPVSLRELPREFYQAYKNGLTAKQMVAINMAMTHSGLYPDVEVATIHPESLAGKNIDIVDRMRPSVLALATTLSRMSQMNYSVRPGVLLALSRKNPFESMHELAQIIAASGFNGGITVSGFVPLGSEYTQTNNNGSGVRETLDLVHQANMNVQPLPGGIQPQVDSIYLSNTLAEMRENGSVMETSTTTVLDAAQESFNVLPGSQTTIAVCDTDGNGTHQMLLEKLSALTNAGIDMSRVRFHPHLAANEPPEHAARRIAACIKVYYWCGGTQVDVNHSGQGGSSNANGAAGNIPTDLVAQILALMNVKVQTPLGVISGQQLWDEHDATVPRLNRLWERITSDSHLTGVDSPFIAPFTLPSRNIHDRLQGLSGVEPILNGLADATECIREFHENRLQQVD